ncbi:hypothetical protein LCGC14_1559880, partial [marine sediment metagenome]
VVGVAGFALCAAPSANNASPVPIDQIVVLKRPVSALALVDPNLGSLAVSLYACPDEV